MILVLKWLRKHLSPSGECLSISWKDIYQMERGYYIKVLLRYLLYIFCERDRYDSDLGSLNFKDFFLDFKFDFCLRYYDITISKITNFYP